jgi:hypothetical protein
METDLIDITYKNIQLMNDIDFLLESISYNDLHILKSTIFLI